MDSNTPTINPVSKKCLACEYEGVENVCPKCKMLMQEKCEKCQMAKDSCICSLIKQ